ncbi:MAG: hypothetical protein IJU23_10825 [Proteobacteria bacterium]|nr:hypothetical protein [Pseudomonadota bacterium]
MTNDEQKHCSHDECCHDHDACECGECECGCGHHECECGHHECGCHHDHQTAQKPRIATPGFTPQNPDKGVSLGPEVEQEIADAMKKRYKRFLEESETFTVKTEVCHHFGLVSATMTNKSRSVHATAEVSVECEDNKIENPIDAYTKALDVIDLVWLDYFDSDRIAHYLPIWQGYEIDSMTVNVRFEHRNPALDDQASEFLKAHGLLENGLSPDDYLDDDELDEDDE